MIHPIQLLPGRTLRAANLYGVKAWRADFYGTTFEALSPQSSLNFTDELSKRQYLEIERFMDTIPEGRLRDHAFERINRLDPDRLSNNEPDVSKWIDNIARAVATQENYQKALAAEFINLVCPATLTASDSPKDTLKGLILFHKLSSIGREVSNLAAAILDPKCRENLELTAGDEAFWQKVSKE
jgi:hypothetical protein